MEIEGEVEIERQGRIRRWKKIREWLNMNKMEQVEIKGEGGSDR